MGGACVGVHASPIRVCGKGEVLECVHVRVYAGECVYCKCVHMHACITMAILCHCRWIACI